MGTRAQSRRTLARPETRPAPDPRQRRVLKIERGPHATRYIVAHLECGHVQRRKMFGCSEPKALICGECPAAGGMAQPHCRARR